MSVATSTSKIQYTLTTGAQALSVPFYFLDNSHIKAVTVATETLPSLTLVLGTDYTLTGAANPAGGTLTTIVTVANELAAGSKIVIKREVPITQPTSYSPNDAFPAKVHEGALDRGVMQAQQLNEKIDRAIHFPEDDSATSLLPSAVDRALTALGFDSSGNAVVLERSQALFTSGDAITFPSVVAMEAYSYASVADKFPITLGGYSATGDGGGGDIYADKADTTTARNGVTVFVASDGTRLKSVFKNYITLRQAGGVADWNGTTGTDNSAALNRAIQACISERIGLICLGAGKFMFGSGIDLTNITPNNDTNLKIIGNGRYATSLFPAINSGNFFDLTGSSFLTFDGFAIREIESPTAYTPNSIFLLARASGNMSAGDHTFRNMWIAGRTFHSTIVLWGSEQNNFYDCLIQSTRDRPAISAAVKISECGFTPASTFTTIGTGEGGCTMNTFYSCRIGNESNTLHSTAVAVLRGAADWLFSCCHFVTYSTAATIDIGGSVYPSDAANFYVSRVTFDTCVDEDPYGLTYKNSINIVTNTSGASKPDVRGLHLRNCSMFNVYAADGTWIDDLNYDGGKYSSTVPAPTGIFKISAYKLTNSRIAPSAQESVLKYQVRNNGTGLTFIGVSAGYLYFTAVTGWHVLDENGNSSSSGIVGPNSDRGVLGYLDGAGGTVTQITSAATSVTLNKPCGRITTVALTTAAGGREEFSVANSKITSVDIPIFSVTYAGAGDPVVFARTVDNGSFRIVVKNVHASDALDAALVINFALIKNILG